MPDQGGKQNFQLSSVDSTNDLKEHMYVSKVEIGNGMFPKLKSITAQGKLTLRWDNKS